MINWRKFDEKTVEKTHGKLYFYRDLYEGNHGELFPRAMDLIAKGEITDQAIFGNQEAQRVRVPYIMLNVSKIIPEITATFVSRSIGDIKTSYKPDDAQNKAATDATDNLIDGTEDDTINGEILHLQQELIDQITKDSELTVAEHWSNIVQQQVDGGLVGVPWKDDSGITIEFKARDVYFPHADGKGADLAYHMEHEDAAGKIHNYLRVYREREVKGNLETRHFLMSVDRYKRTEEVEEEEAKEILQMDELEETFIGRSRRFIKYWANDKTFTNPLGVSVLKGQGGKQDEINWTMTRQAIIFQRNGTPRMAVSKEIFAQLQRVALDRYGDASKIDSGDLEITTLDENGNALQIIQIDVTKIGTIENVKNLMKAMLMETQTSEKAIDFYMDGGTAGAASGIAKYYDLLMTLLKSERVQQEYIHFLKELYESALWLANQDDKGVIVEQPVIETSDFITSPEKEVVETNALAVEKGIRSVETAIRKVNKGAAEEWIEAEEERISFAKTSSDSVTLSAGPQDASFYLDNRKEGTTAIAAGTAGEEE